MNNLPNFNDCDSSTESEIGQELDNKIRTYSSGRIMKIKSQIDIKLEERDTISNYR